MPGARFTKDGVLVLAARGSRSQQENLEAARARLLELVLLALSPNGRRLRVRVPRDAREQRLAAKHRTASRKRARHDHGED